MLIIVLKTQTGKSSKAYVNGLFLKTMTFFHRCLQNGTWSEILGCKQMSNVGKEGKRSILLTAKALIKTTKGYKLLLWKTL